MAEWEQQGRKAHAVQDFLWSLCHRIMQNERWRRTSRGGLHQDSRSEIPFLFYLLCVGKVRCLFSLRSLDFIWFKFLQHISLARPSHFLYNLNSNGRPFWGNTLKVFQGVTSLCTVMWLHRWSKTCILKILRHFLFLGEKTGFNIEGDWFLKVWWFLKSWIVTILTTYNRNEHTIKLKTYINTVKMDLRFFSSGSKTVSRSYFTFLFFVICSIFIMWCWQHLVFLICSLISLVVLQKIL